MNDSHGYDHTNLTGHSVTDCPVVRVMGGMSVGRWLSFGVGLCVLGRIVNVSTFGGRLRPSSARSAFAHWHEASLEESDHGWALSAIGTGLRKTLVKRLGRKKAVLSPHHKRVSYRMS